VLNELLDMNIASLDNINLSALNINLTSR